MNTATAKTECTTARVRRAAAAMSALILSAAPGTAAISATDLVAYWKLDGDLTDSVGGNDGSIQDVDGGGDNTGFAMGFDGTANGAIDVRGTTDRVQTPFVIPVGPKSMSLFFASSRETWSGFAGGGGNDGSGNWTKQFTVAGHRHQSPTNQPQGLTLLLGTSFFHLDPSSAFSPSATDLVGNDTYHHVVITDDGAGSFTAYYRSPSDSFHSVFTGTYSGTAGGDNTILHIGGRQYSGIDSDARVDDVAIFNRVLTQTEAESIWAAGSVAAAITGPDPLVLKISRSGANLDFEWNSRDGRYYDLLSSVELDSAPATWPAYQDGVATYRDIPASGTGTNNLSDVVPLGSKRFFVVAEKDPPPPAWLGNELPSLMEFLDGREVVTPQDWEQRRDEIRDLLIEHFVGAFPEQTPGIVSAQVTSDTTAPDGSQRRRIQITLDTPNQKSFEMAVWTPPGPGPFPLLLTAPRYYQLFWAEDALARGYAVCLYPGVDSNHSEANYPGYESVWQTFRNEYPQATWTEISTKGWLASRCLDYLLGAGSVVPVQGRNRSPSSASPATASRP